MTKGDRDKLRAELAGKAIIGIGIGNWRPNADYGPMNWDSREEVVALKARWAVAQADALMAELGISMEDDK